MFNKLSLFLIIGLGALFTPIIALAQADEDVPNAHKFSDLAINVAPFLIMAVLFWFFFRRTIRKQQTSPLVMRQQEYLTRHEQHMERMEQLHERIAKALEKDRL